eukprot:12403347-Karenia_brevis.AAC.1
MRRTDRRDAEDILSKAIRASVKEDKRRWLESLASSGSWDDLRRLRKKSSSFMNAKLNDENGNQVFSHERAETFATHMEKVQWAVRYVTLAPERAAIWDLLP